MTPASSHDTLCVDFETKAGLAFNDRDLLRTAFTHRSYLNEAVPRLRTKKGDTPSPKEAKHGAHNERLEFLGDAVLELVVTDHLFKKFPTASEGELTSYRAALVNAVILSDIAEKLGMNDCLLLSRGEAKDTGRARATILANTFEAVVGALYLDQGIEATSIFIERAVLSRLDDVLASGSWRDAKSAFQEYAQEKYGITPKYDTVRADGPDHDKHFVVSVSVGGSVIAEGEGKSKQDAEQVAARKALQESQNLP